MIIFKLIPTILYCVFYFSLMLLSSFLALIFKNIYVFYRRGEGLREKERENLRLPTEHGAQQGTLI